MIVSVCNILKDKDMLGSDMVGFLFTHTEFSLISSRMPLHAPIKAFEILMVIEFKRHF